MKDRRKNKTKRKVLLALYLAVCLVIIVAAYFHLSRIARNFNTEHLELITGLYAEKMNDSMEFLYLILDYSHNHYTFKHFGV